MAVKPWLAGAIAGLALIAAACGEDDPATTASTVAPGVTGPASTAAASDLPAAATTDDLAATTAPDDTVDGDDGDDGDAPTRIVSLAPTHTETLFAIGAGPQVIAVDDQSNHPPEAEAVRTDLSGYQPNVEAIAGYEPDLVVTSGDDALIEQLEALGLTVWVGPSATTFDDAYSQIEQLGAATGHVAEAAELVGQMQAELDALAADVPTSENPLSVYHELSPDGYSAGSITFIGQIYELFGLRNIADSVEDQSGYPQLNAETIIEADPDLIFLADSKCCGESLETVSARDGWDQITAVQNGNVFAMDDDVASRWGPRFVEYAQQVHDAIEQALVPAG